MTRQEFETLAIGTLVHVRYEDADIEYTAVVAGRLPPNIIIANEVSAGYISAYDQYLPYTICCEVIS